MLRDEAGAHVPSLELGVAGETQQEVDVGVQPHDLKTGGGDAEVTGRFSPLRLGQSLCLTLYCRKQ